MSQEDSKEKTESESMCSTTVQPRNLPATFPDTGRIIPEKVKLVLEGLARACERIRIGGLDGKKIISSIIEMFYLSSLLSAKKTSDCRLPLDNFKIV